MKLATLFGSSASSVGMAAAGAVVVVAGAIGFTVLNDPQEVPEPAAVEAAPDVAVADPEPDPAPLPEVEPDPEAEQSPSTPLLDVVRVDPDGNTVIAGQSAPNVTIAVLIGGDVVAEVSADVNGDFVALLTVPPSDEPRAVTVEARPNDGPAIPGAETVLIAPFGAPAEPVASADPEPVPSIVADVTPEALEAEPEPGPVIAVEADPEITEPEPGPVASTEPEPAPAPAPSPRDVGAQPDTPTDEGTVDIAEAEPDLPVSNPDTATLIETPSTQAPETENDEIAAPGPDPTSPPAAAPGALANSPSAPTLPNIGQSPDVIAALSAQPDASAPAVPSAPSVVIAGPEGVRIAQDAAGQPQVQTEVRLDAISYDAQGAVILAGRGPVAADIQVYLNNQPIQLGEIGPGGNWSLELPNVDPGTYTLAVAEIGPSGAGESRVDTPFLREDPERVAEVPEVTQAGTEVITVQPGFTLWGMARDRFGDGILYVQIFEENRDQIRDPNWIFPGQIFRMPEIETQN